ncbi:MAG: hypothetical protein FJ280_27320 [Planctomycetes bacterium]|nr:hypothetical protein [Planctomycetota bacterium]
MGLVPMSGSPNAMCRAGGLGYRTTLSLPPRARRPCCSWAGRPCYLRARRPCCSWAGRPCYLRARRPCYSWAGRPCYEGRQDCWREDICIQFCLGVARASFLAL